MGQSVDLIEKWSVVANNHDFVSGPFAGGASVGAEVDVERGFAFAFTACHVVERDCHL